MLYIPPILIDLCFPTLLKSSKYQLFSVVKTFYAIKNQHSSQKMRVDFRNQVCHDISALCNFRGYIFGHFRTIGWSIGNCDFGHFRTMD